MILSIWGKCSCRRIEKRVFLHVVVADTIRFLQILSNYLLKANIILKKIKQNPSFDHRDLKKNK